MRNLVSVPCILHALTRLRTEALRNSIKDRLPKLLIPSPGEAVLPWKPIVVTAKRGCSREQTFLPVSPQNHHCARMSGCRQHRHKDAFQALMFFLVLELPKLQPHGWLCLFPSAQLVEYFVFVNLASEDKIL